MLKKQMHSPQQFASDKAVIQIDINTKMYM